MCECLFSVAFFDDDDDYNLAGFGAVASSPEIRTSNYHYDYYDDEYCSCTRVTGCGA